MTPAFTLNAVPGDPDDNRILECAITAGSDAVVTGDKDLLRLKAFENMKIMSVADFLGSI